MAVLNHGIESLFVLRYPVKQVGSPMLLVSNVPGIPCAWREESRARIVMSSLSLQGVYGLEMVTVGDARSDGMLIDMVDLRG